MATATAVVCCIFFSLQFLNRLIGSGNRQQLSIGSGLDQPVRGNQLRRADKNNQHQLLTNQTSEQQILREEKSADQSTILANSIPFDRICR
jgi:hypothetical protein